MTFIQKYGFALLSVVFAVPAIVLCILPFEGVYFKLPYETYLIPLSIIIGVCFALLSLKRRNALWITATIAVVGILILAFVFFAAVIASNFYFGAG